MTKARRRSPSTLVHLVPSDPDNRPQEKSDPTDKTSRCVAAETTAAKEPRADENSHDAAARLMQAFVNDVLADWRAHGSTAIAAVRTDRAHDYLKLVTSLFPREGDAKVSGLDELSDEQLGEQLASVLAQLAAAGSAPGA